MEAVFPRQSENFMAHLKKIWDSQLKIRDLWDKVYVSNIAHVHAVDTCFSSRTYKLATFFNPLFAADNVICF